MPLSEELEICRRVRLKVGDSALHSDHAAGTNSRPRPTPVHLKLRRLLGNPAKPKQGAHREPLHNVVVDLTPVLPGGENGGSKPMTLGLLKNMIARSPATKFSLLTLLRTRDELTGFRQPNVEVVVVPDEEMALPPATRRFFPFLRLPGTKPKYKRSWVNRLGGTVLFCPFAAPFFAESRIPIVSVIHDIQYADYPQYFEEHVRAQRHRNFTDACRRAARIICISEFVRRRVLEESGLPPNRVITVYIQLAQRLAPPSSDSAELLLDRLRLTAGRYLFYPANFWKHKNHEMLFVALGLFFKRWPNSDLKLVCTGAPGERKDFLQSAAERMGLTNRIVFPGFVADSDFSALLHNCLAVIYPSLYEGFGMPLVEAQTVGKPVLCGDITSLPEVTGGAALVFDPKLPESIAAAIQQIDYDPAISEKLISQGLANAKRFADADHMADDYLRTLAEAVHGTSFAEPKHPDA